MYEINQLYRQHIENELTTLETDRSLLNKDMVEAKILSFLSELGHVGEESQCYSFWDHSLNDNQELFDVYLDGFHMLLSIGFELKIDHLKNYNEIPEQVPIRKQFIKIYQQALLLNQSYLFDDFQNLVDDYLTLGFKLGLDFNDIFKHYSETYK